MADASIDIRIFENKEMKAVDMAELMDAAIFRNGVIQGCETKIENGLFTIEGGRIVVGGRLGVVTGGTVPNPTALSKTDICYPIAVCDLADANKPFYFMIATKDDLTSLGLDYENRSSNFNVQNGRDALFFGTVEVDPATGLINQNTYQKWGQATARKGWEWYTTILNEIQKIDTKYNDKLTWKSVQEADYQGTDFHAIPAGAKEIYVVIWIRWTAGDNSQKTSIGFHIPVNDTLFVSSASLVGHVNHWTKTNDGFVRLRLVKNNEGYFVQIYNVYQGDTDVTNSAYWRILYR